MDVEHRELDRESRDLARPAPLRLARHECAVRRGAADIEGECQGIPARPRDARRGREPGGRAREQLAHRLARGERGRGGPAVRQDDLELGVEPGRECPEVARDARHQVGVGHRGGEALVLAHLRAQRRGAAHRDAEAAERALEPALVGGLGIGVQQSHRHRLGYQAPHPSHRGAHRGGGERLEHPPAGSDPLAHPHAPRGGHQRLDAARRERIELRAVLAPDLEQVLEARGGHERDARALPLEQRVGRDRRAVPHSGPGPRRPAARARVCDPEPGQALEHRALGSRGRRGELERHDAPAREYHEIGEGAAGVDPGRARSAAGAHARAFESRRMRSTRMPITISAAAPNTSQVGSFRACPTSARAK